MPLGVLKPDEFELNLQYLHLDAGQKIVCYTDGVIEARDENGEQYGQDRLEAAMCHSQATISALFDSVSQHANKVADDDVTILTMQFPVTSGTDGAHASQPTKTFPITYDTQLHFSAKVLQNVTLMTEIRQYFSGMIHGSDLDLVCTILSELFANAIDHGLLKLSSSMKDDPDGFYLFYQQREEQLKQLGAEYWVNLSIHFDPVTKRFTFAVEHNGEGFDYQRINQDEQPQDSHGRGILIVAQLCSSLHYSKGGCCVTVEYKLDSHC